MAGRRKTSAPRTEWVGGTAPMPATITGEGESYRPDMLVWLNPAEGVIVGMTAVRPGEAVTNAAEHLRETILAPAAGPPGPPSRVRVASPELADALRAAFPTLEIVVARTPEVDTVVGNFSEAMAGTGEDDPGWLADGLPPDAVGAFFDAMAALWRGAPWSAVPADDPMFRVGVEALGVRDAIAVVMGQMRESFGVLLFDSLEDHDRYAAIGEALRRGDARGATALGEMPRCTALDFDPVERVPPTRREERQTHRWTLADEHAFPSLTCREADLEERAPTLLDLTLGEALARAFAVAFEDEDTFEEAWYGGEPVEHRVTVATREGEVEVVLGAPVEGVDATRRAPDAPPERVYRLRIELEEVDWNVPDGEVSPHRRDVRGCHAAGPARRDPAGRSAGTTTICTSSSSAASCATERAGTWGSPMGDVEQFFDTGDDPRSVEETRLDDLGLVRRRCDALRVRRARRAQDHRVDDPRAAWTDDVDLPREVGATGEVPGQYGDAEE